jgi:hypothetical protein
MAAPRAGEPPRRSFAALARAAAPPLAAAGAIAWIACTVRWHEFAAAFAGRPLAPYLALSTALLLADWLCETWALKWTLGRIGARMPYRELACVRGATYLVGALQYYLGQAAILAYLHGRAKVSLVRGAGMMLVVGGLNFDLLLAVGTTGLLAQPHPLAWVRPLAAGVLATAAAWGIVLWRKPPAIARRAALAPFFELGARGHALGLAAWAPYLAVQVGWYWITLRFFGVPVPASIALSCIPVVIASTALPLSLQGIGLPQVAAVYFFAGYAAGGTGAARVAAATLVMSTTTLVVQVALGLLVLPAARRAGVAGG